MKTYLILLLYSSAILGSLKSTLAQETVVVTYQVEFKKHIDRPSKIKTYTKLIIKSDQSVYIDDRKLTFKNIAVKNVSKEEKNKAFAILRTPDFKEIIIKNYPNEETIVVYEEIKDQIIAYKNPSFTKDFWNISTDITTNILGLQAYKAACEFGGRKWTAWFSPEIAVPDGPYKFYGLPGLILKLSSEDEEYTFQVSGLEKLNDYEINSYIPKYKVLDQIKFKEIQTYYESNALNKAMANGTTIVGDITVNGKRMTQEEFGLLLRKETENINSIEKK